jgi:hypothetical protein
VRGVVEYMLDGMVDPTAVTAAPDPLVMARPYHSADYRDPRWVIDPTEANRVLAYWRARAYHLASSLDGFAPGPGDTNGATHSADYRAAFWLIDGTEANRVLAYLRAGGYHTDPAGLDGYAPGPSGAGLLARRSPKDGGLVLVHQGPATYTCGGNIQITNRVEYTGTLLSLLWRPKLPSGWTLLSATGDGNPESIADEILWSGSIPASPILMVYTVQVPAGDHAPKALRGEVEYQASGMVNPVTQYAGPDPLVLVTVRIVGVFPESGQISFTLVGEVGRRYRVEASGDLNSWSEVKTVTLGDGTLVITQPLAGRAQFFRATLLP